MKVLAIDIGGTHVKILATGSTQYSARTQLVLKTKAKITRYARSAGTLPWLGFEQVQPTGRLSQGAPSNQRIGWCCIDLSRPPGTLAKYIRENVSEDVEVNFTDDFWANTIAMRKAGIKNYKTITHSKGQYLDGDTHTNTVESAFSLLKRGITETWHKISAKHLPVYLEEMSFRFNRRKRSDLFFDTLRHMVTAPVLTLEKLTA
jgi:hypothetical protein